MESAPKNGRGPTSVPFSSALFSFRLAPILAAAVLILLLPCTTSARGPLVRPIEDASVPTLPASPTAATDTPWFGGSGTGNGSVVLGGNWDWEASSGETPLFFPDGDPIGNQYRDGWTFEVFTSRGGPSPLGSGHWRSDGTYDFLFDKGSFAHRATTHPNDGVNDGPAPLDDPANGLGNSLWSVWIGTNQYLNPEHCDWTRTAGYGDAWSNGVLKVYRFRTTPGPGEFPAPPAGAAIDLSFYHRYAIEADFDYCLVEISPDGIVWGPPSDLVRSWTEGDHNSPRPAASGGPETVDLKTWPGGNGDLYVRLRLVSDSSFSDEEDGGNFFFAWQADDLRLRVNQTAIDLADFETNMGGWEPRRFEGEDARLSGDPALAASRIDALQNLTCNFGSLSCGVAHNVLFFFDRDQCDPGGSGFPVADAFAAAVRSPAFAIPAGSAQAETVGRFIRLDYATDESTGAFNCGLTLCTTHSPAGSGRCPYTPPPGSPGAGSTFDWARLSTYNCDFFDASNGPFCRAHFIDNATNNLPAAVDSVIFYVGVFSQCPSEGDCAPVTAVPVFDNVRFGVLDPGVAGAGEPNAPKLESALGHPQPNPARGAATIRYSVAETGHTSLRVVDAAGRVVRTIFDGEKSIGIYGASWDGKDDAGRPVAPGVFFFELRTVGQTATRKLVVLE